MTGSNAPDGLQRCAWALGSERYRAYHDEEWGVPVHDDRVFFEFLVLEGAQAGLSWSTILAKRDGYRRLFAQFDPAAVAGFSAERIEALLTDPAIVRNRAKVAATVGNAGQFLRIQEEFGSFDRYIWRFVEGSPVQHRWRALHEVPSRTAQSDAMSRDLRARGFKFVGTTICYALMQATGLVNDHTTGCFRHAACRLLG